MSNKSEIRDLITFLDEFFYKLQMLVYDRIDVSEGIYFSRINRLRECSVCNYCYFLKVNFRFQAIACDDCHDLMQKSYMF